MATKFMFFPFHGMDSKCIVSFLIFGFFCVRCGIFLNNVLIIKIMCGINVVLRNLFIVEICVYILRY